MSTPNAAFVDITILDTLAEAYCKQADIDRNKIIYKAALSVATNLGYTEEDLQKAINRRDPCQTNI